MSNKNKLARAIRKPLQEKGLAGAIHKTYSTDKITVDFHFVDNTILGKIENFSEKTVIDFVANSYYKSCLTLLAEVKKYVPTDKKSKMDACAYRYLPAMYCFRHYLELKLKYLYMCYANESFNVTCHTLSDLLNELKAKGFSSNVFDEPISYIEALEKIKNGQVKEDSYFRYLINKKMVCQESLEIPMYEFSKIKNYITDIEYYTNVALYKKFYDGLFYN